MVAENGHCPETAAGGGPPTGAGTVRKIGFRRQSQRRLWGLPLYDIALGPDLERGEYRGHARGVFAVGDIATGIVAIGGVAKGVVALGGLALGVFSLGGLSLGILVALGGASVGGCALGGLSIGLFAVGGAAVGVIAQGALAVGVIANGMVSVGYYACGAVAWGQHVVSGTRADAQAVQFFGRWFPESLEMIQQMRAQQGAQFNAPLK